MKLLSIMALTSLSLNLYASSDNILKVPFYFSLPEYSHLKIKDNNWVKIPTRNEEVVRNDKGEIIKTIDVTSDNTYLRGYFYKDASSEGRIKALKELQEKNLIQTGDIVLSFRPSWTDTVPYAHLQMGTSHAGLAYVEDGVVKNIDMPLTDEYIVKRKYLVPDGNIPLEQFFTSELDSDHYVTAPFVHILRSRSIDERRQKNLLDWIAQIQKNYESIVSNHLLIFNKDYSKSKYDNYSKKDGFVTSVARVILGLDTTSQDLTLFCSEFVWTMLALSNCAVDDKEILNKNIVDAKCVKPTFNAMKILPIGNNPGLIEGPLSILKAMKFNENKDRYLDSFSFLESLNYETNKRLDLVDSLFSIQGGDRLSSGHAAMANDPTVKALMSASKKVYELRLENKNITAALISKIVNNKADMDNYSPTAFLVNALLAPSPAPKKNNNPEHEDEKTEMVEHPKRDIDYVGTVIFGDIREYIR